MIDDTEINNQPIVLFDGVCNLCNSSIDFLVRHEKGDALRFASLQSEVGQHIIAKSNLKQIPDSILFYENSNLAYKSKAVLSVAKHLKMPWRLAIVFRIIPSFISNMVYDWIARNRYRWFGKKETCRVPTPEEREKFLG